MFYYSCSLALGCLFSSEDRVLKVPICPAPDLTLSSITSMALALTIPENTLHSVFTLIGAPLLCGRQQPLSLLTPTHQYFPLTSLQYSKILTISYNLYGQLFDSSYCDFQPGLLSWSTKWSFTSGPDPCILLSTAAQMILLNLEANHIITPSKTPV